MCAFYCKMSPDGTRTRDVAPWPPFFRASLKCRPSRSRALLLLYFLLAEDTAELHYLRYTITFCGLQTEAKAAWVDGEGTKIPAHGGGSRQPLLSNCSCCGRCGLSEATFAAPLCVGVHVKYHACLIAIGADNFQVHLEVVEILRRGGIGTHICYSKTLSLETPRQVGAQGRATIAKRCHHPLWIFLLM